MDSDERRRNIQDGRADGPGTRALLSPRNLVVLLVVILIGAAVGAAALRDRGSGGPAGDPPSRDDVAARDGSAPGGEAGPGVSDGAGAASERETGVASTEPASGPVEPEPRVWAAPTDPSPVEPVAAADRVPKPAAVRGIYVGSWPVGSRTRLDRLIALAEATEINAFVIDVKDATGRVTHESQVPLARQVGATDSVRIHDLRATLARLRERGIYPIARIVVFKDPILARVRPEWAIRREDGSVWEDDNGVLWVDSYNPNVWEYNIELAREAIALGFSEVQWDYIRFPDAPNSFLQEAVYPARAGRTRVQGIREFMIHTRERLADLGVPITADVFGITTSADTDVGIGQLWEQMADVMDVLLPMVYPSHYPAGSWSYDNPNAAPYQIVKRAMDDGVERSRAIEGAATIRPWLQAFSLGEPSYGPRHVRAQIDAVYDAGLTEWILWNPGVRYSAEPLATADGRPPWFDGLGATLHPPDPPELDTPTFRHRFEQLSPPRLEVRRDGGAVRPEG